MKPILRALLLALLASPLARAQEITVSAASSLTEAFREIGRAFEKRHPGARVLFNFGASDKLLQQITAGAPVDVFASADPVAMDKAVAGRAVDPATRVDFAGNTLVLIVPLDAPRVPGGAKDLLDPAFTPIAIGNPASVPAGRYAREALDQLGLWQPLEGRFVLALSVRQALDYVSRGEAQAGFVYATDAAVARGRVRMAATLPAARPVTYPIAVVASTARRPVAAAFVAFVAGDGQAVLARHGFSRPGAR